MTADIHLHPHAVDRLALRGVTEREVIEAVRIGERFEAKYGRTGFRAVFVRPFVRRGKSYPAKEVQAFAVWEDESWLVISIKTRFFREVPG
jgi:hypothetical protein